MSKVVYLGVYAFSGVTFLSYLAYKGFQEAANKVKIERVEG